MVVQAVEDHQGAAGALSTALPWESRGRTCGLESPHAAACFH